jgi:hypothetical protein
VSNLYAATVCLIPADVESAVDELAAVEARLHDLGAIRPEAWLDRRTGTVHVRFNVVAEVGKIVAMIDALVGELSSEATWMQARSAYYSEAGDERGR